VDWAALSAIIALAAYFFLEQGTSHSVSVNTAATPHEREFDQGRGPLPTPPSEIPVGGWKDILVRVYRIVSDHRVALLGAGITFYGSWRGGLGIRFPPWRKANSKANNLLDDIELRRGERLVCA
jgi:hypothetical protein